MVDAATLTDQILGEISHMRYIYSFDILELAREDESIQLSKLPEKMKEMGFQALIHDPGRLSGSLYRV